MTMVHVLCNHTLRISKRLLSDSKGDTMLFLVDKIFRLIPFESYLCHKSIIA